MKPIITFDADEGRYVAVGCLSCHEDVTGYLAIASPFMMYVAAIACPECGSDLIQYDVLSEEVA